MGFSTPAVRSQVVQLQKTTDALARLIVDLDELIGRVDHVHLGYEADELRLLREHVVSLRMQLLRDRLLDVRARLVAAWD